MTYDEECERKGRDLIAKHGFPNMIGKPRPWPAVRKVRFRTRVEGRFNWASRTTAATVTIANDPQSTFTVQPFRLPKRYALPLQVLAAWCVRSIIAAEVRTKKQKKGRRK